MMHHRHFQIYMMKMPNNALGLNIVDDGFYKGSIQYVTYIAFIIKLKDMTKQFLLDQT